MRNLQSHAMVSVRSTEQPAHKRIATPEITVITLPIDAAKKQETTRI